jgi:hypothetical protein
MLWIWIDPDPQHWYKVNCTLLKIFTKWFKVPRWSSWPWSPWKVVAQLKTLASKDKTSTICLISWRGPQNMRHNSKWYDVEVGMWDPLVLWYMLGLDHYIYIRSVGRFKGALMIAPHPQLYTVTLWHAPSDTNDSPHVMLWPCDTYAISLLIFHPGCFCGGLIVTVMISPAQAI